MNIKTTKKLIIAMIFIIAIIILGNVNKVEAKAEWDEKDNLEVTYGNEFTISADQYNRIYFSNVLVHKLDKNGKVVEKNLKRETKDGKFYYHDGNAIISYEDVGFSAGYGIKGMKILITNDTTETRYYRIEVEFYAGKYGNKTKKNFDITVNCKNDKEKEVSNQPGRKSIVTIEYYNNDKMLTYTDTGKGTIIKLAYVPTLEGHEFMGWTKTKGGKNVEYNPNQEITVNTSMTLYAVWAPIDSKGDLKDDKAPKAPTGDLKDDKASKAPAGDDFTIQYFDGSTEYTKLKKTGSFGETVILASAQTKEGYTFKEWNTEPDGTGTPRKAGSSLSVNKTKEIKYYAQWEKTSGSKEDDEPKKDDKSSGGLSGLLGKLINFGTSALPTVVETGMSFINSDTVQKLTESAFGGLSKIIGGITGNSGNIGNSIFSIFSSKKQGNVETPTNTEDVPTENIEDNIQEEKGVKVLYKELNKEVEGSIVNLYVIQLEEDLSIDNEKLGKIIINNKYPIYIMQADNGIVALMGIESGNEGYNYGDGKLYLDEDGKIYKKVDNEYIEIAKFEKTIEGLEEADLEKEENYYILKTEQLAVAITSQDLEKLLSTETNESAGNVEYNDTQDTGANVSGGQSTGFGGLNISGTLSNILSSDLLETGLGMVENFAGTATGLIGGALDKVGEATGATGITGMLKGVLNTAGEMVSNGTVRSAAQGGINVLMKIGNGLGQLFGAK